MADGEEVCFKASAVTAALLALFGAFSAIKNAPIWLARHSNASQSGS